MLAVLMTAFGCDTATSPVDTVNPNRLRADGLHLIVSTSRPGANSLTFEIKVENRGPTDQTLVFGSSQAFDVEVRDRSGAIVWLWSHDKTFLPYMSEIELAAGESFTGSGTDWDLTGNDGNPLSPGSYKSKVFITCFPRDSGLVAEFLLTL